MDAVPREFGSLVICDGPAGQALSVCPLRQSFRSLADHPQSIGRKRTRAEIRQILLDHNLEEPLKAQGEWPFD